MLSKLSFSIIIHPTPIFVLTQQIYTPQILSRFDPPITCSLCRSPFMSGLASRDALKVGFLVRARPFFTPVHLLFKTQVGSVLEYCSHMSVRFRLLLYLMEFNAAPCSWSNTTPWHLIYNHYPIFGWLLHRPFSIAVVIYFFFWGCFVSSHTFNLRFPIRFPDF